MGDRRFFEIHWDDNAEDDVMAAVDDGDRYHDDDGYDDNHDYFYFVGKVFHHAHCARSISRVRSVGCVFKAFILKIIPPPRAYGAFSSWTNTRKSRRRSVNRTKRKSRSLR